MVAWETTAVIQRAKERGAWILLRYVFSFPALLGILLVLGGFVGVYKRLPDPDTWSHIASGNEILATRGWPETDSFSFTAQGNPSMAFEWVGQVGTALAARAGLTGLMVLLVGLSSAFLLLLYYYCYLRSGNSKAAFVACACLLPLLSVFFRVRPQIMGYIFLLLTLVCLERFRLGHERALWLLPPLFLVWVNTHATFVFGLMVLGLSWFCGLWRFERGGLRAERWPADKRQQLLIAILACVLVLPLTPYGTRLAAFPFHVALNAPLGTTHITEYLPVASYPILMKIFIVLILLLLLIQILLRLDHRLEDLVLFLFATYVAFVHTRFLLLFLLFLAPVIAALLARWIPPYAASKDRPILNASLMLLSVAGMGYFFPGPAALEKDVAREYPVGAINYLRGHAVPARLLNNDAWGGFMMWQVGPQRKVFIDGRSQLYEEAGVFKDYLAIMDLDRSTLSLLRKYDVEACLIRKDSMLATFLAVLPDWRQIYSDELSVIFVRETSSVNKR